MSNSKIQAVSGGRLDEQSTSEDDFEPVLRLNTRDGPFEYQSMAEY